MFFGGPNLFIDLVVAIVKHSSRSGSRFEINSSHEYFATTGSGGVYS